MEGAPVTAATGALGPVISKLAALLGSEYKLRQRTRRDVKFIRCKLKPVHSILWNIWEREELDEASKKLKMEALDLADDVDDAIVDFMLSLERSGNTKRLVQTKIKASPFLDFKKRASDVSKRCRSKWKGKEKPAVTSSPGKPRAYPFVRKDASELVGMDEPRDKLIKHLVGEDETTPVEMQLKTASILGMAGMGKSTLADLVYEKIKDKFQVAAFVSVARPGGNMREVLAGILEQVAANSTVPLARTKASTEEHLIDIISKFLADKRYLVIVDDIWNWREWEVIMKALPDNNLGSRIVRTTRTRGVANKWHDDPCEPDYLLHDMHGKENIATLMIAMKADLVAKGFDNEHDIVRMCDDTPLAVCCMLSAVAHELEKQAQQGLHAKACDVQDEIVKRVKESGIQNTPGFEPLVESLQLGYDDLPHHMLKTCLLYCSRLFPDGYDFEQYICVREWILEGFVCSEEEVNCYFEELVDRGLILYHLTMLPMMRNFLRWKSQQDNFITHSSEITPSYACTIRRLFIDNSQWGFGDAAADSQSRSGDAAADSQSRSGDAAADSPSRSGDAAADSPSRSGDAAADPFSALDWSHIRSLIVKEGIDCVPLKTLEGVRLLDLCWSTDLRDHHLKDICGLVRLRHLVGLNSEGISEIPPEIVTLQCLETFEVYGSGLTQLPGFVGKLQRLKTLDVRGSDITVLPKEIGALQQLETLRICYTGITELPRDICSLVQLKTLDISDTRITVLPKEIGKLQHLEHLRLRDTKVAKIPREIRALKELKSLELDASSAALPLEVCSALVELPECIDQALKKSGLVSELAGQMLSLQKRGLVVGAKQMHIPAWIKEHFNDLVLLDIRICRLEEGGLKILREMPKLYELALRFQVVPREPVVISRQGFPKLRTLTIDSRVPRVTFQEGAMPELMYLIFQFQFYAGPPNIDPVGITHLKRLSYISFECNEDWYGGEDSPCIRSTIDIVRKEAMELPWRARAFIHVCGS